MMIDTNYLIEALDGLLDRDCVSERYYPLIPLKYDLMARAQRQGYRTKNELAALSASGWEALGLQDERMIGLLRRFLTMYDPNPRKFAEIQKLNIGADEYRAFCELYYLPGVRQTRASLYYVSGYPSLKAVAAAKPTDILNQTARAISENHLSCIQPLPKEVRTHIAVAGAFTQDR